MFKPDFEFQAKTKSSTFEEKSVYTRIYIHTHMTTRSNKFNNVDLDPNFFRIFPQAAE